jgi:hypothetical protein
MATSSHSESPGTLTSLHGLTIILLILSLIANVVTISLLTGFSFPYGNREQKVDTLGFRQTLLDLEYEKV